MKYIKTNEKKSDRRVVCGVLLGLGIDYGLVYAGVTYRSGLHIGKA